MKVLLPISLAVIVVILASGCTTPMTQTNELSFVNNPEQYLGKQVVFTASPMAMYVLPYQYDMGFRRAIRLEDKSGKPMTIPLKYDTFYCTTCKITGIVQRFATCMCQHYSCNGTNCGGAIINRTRINDTYEKITKETDNIDWNKAISEDFLTMPVEKCGNNGSVAYQYGQMRRCKPGTNGFDYFLDVNDVVKIE